MHSLFDSLIENKVYIFGSIGSWILTALSYRQPILFVEVSNLVPYAQLLALSLGSVVSLVTLFKILKDWDGTSFKK